MRIVIFVLYTVKSYKITVYIQEKKGKKEKKMWNWKHTAAFNWIQTVTASKAALLFLHSCLTPSLSVFLMLQSKKQKHHHRRNHQICNPPQPNPSRSLSLLSRILSLVLVMAKPLGSTTVSGSGAHLCHHHH